MICRYREYMKLLAPAVAIMLGAGVATAAFVFMSHRGNPPSGPHKTPSPNPAAPPAVVPAPPLDGRYLLEYDGAKQTRNGQPFPAANHSDWYAFRSACTPVGCTATGTELDSNNHPIPTREPFRPVFHWADGQWQGGFSFDFECTYAQDVKGNGPPFPYIPGSELFRTYREVKQCRRRSQCSRSPTAAISAPAPKPYSLMRAAMGGESL